MDQIREAFLKVKTDILLLNDEFSKLQSNIEQTTEMLREIVDVLVKIKDKTSHLEKNQKEFTESLNPSFLSEEISKNLLEKLKTSFQLENIYSKQEDFRRIETPTPNPAHLPKFQTNPTPNPALLQEIKGLKTQNISFSTGNEGVPADTQTDRQTHKQTPFSLKNNENLPKTQTDPFEILNSLDELRKEIRLKFKRLTDQEVIVFSTIYQVDEQQGPVDYKTLSKKLNLTESSIRDYIGRLIKKGIPVDKTKLNNKIIQVSIPLKLKKIATLSTILQLREL